MASTSAVRKPRNETSNLHDGDATRTRGRILDATFRRLVTDGYAALSVREIARDAGVNHALINYHFRTKDQLVIDVLDAMNQRLLARQASMYDSDAGFASKWASARRFYQDDLDSGFVRLQAELWAASFSNSELRDKFLPRVLAWKQLVLGGVRDAISALEAAGTKLPPPFTPDVIACWISEFWLGMEFADLMGVKEEQIQHRAALDAVESLLKSLDAKMPVAAKTKTKTKINAKTEARTRTGSRA